MIQGRFKMYLIVKIFMAVWFGILLVGMPLFVTSNQIKLGIVDGDILSLLLDILHTQLMISPMALLGLVFLLIAKWLDSKKQEICFRFT